MIARFNIVFWFESIIHSYTQVFFSKNKILGVLLIITTFFDFSLGLSGLLAVIISNLLALILGFDRKYISEGSYGFNGLLVGLGLGLFYEPNTAFFVLLVVAMLITVLVTIATSGFLAKYALPYLSIPFLVGIWSVLLASRGFESLGLSQKGVYMLNELYASGEVWLVNTYHWFNESNIPLVVLIYLKSLGAILFQFNALSGIIIAIGLLIYSRIAFSLSILSFLVAYYFYLFIGADIDALGYSYIGFNFILSGIALGSFFLVPSKSSYLWAFALVPPMVVITAAVGSIFSLIQIGMYSLPFNMVVLIFLYVLKLRIKPNSKPEEVAIQLYSPEKNLYERLSNAKRYSNFKWQAIGLPFFGEWSVSQGHKGSYTHKEEWKEAWDFVIMDDDNKQFKNEGDFREDYFCFNKPVLASGDGVIEKVLTGIEDNTIGDSNLHQNWGNSVVIKHGYQLYSQVSHLKEDSIKLKKGDEVKKGDIIGRCGNSGRSPYPHLHFQVQQTPFIGSKTMEYPLSTYLVKKNDTLKFKFFDFPKKDAIIKSVETQKLMTSAFHFVPGRTLTFKVNDGTENKNVTWKVENDMYNNRYLYCSETNSKAFFVNDDTLHYFTLFEGKRDSLLYYFFIGAYKVLLSYYDNLSVKEQYPLHLLAPSGLRYLHDFTAPFFQYMSAQYRLEYISIDDDLSPNKIELHSSANLKLINKITKQIDFKFIIKNSRFASFEIKTNNKTIIAQCTE
ncbi:MAG: peptidase M23 [Bacteroidetes bacterium]|nr:MAG: peptidase M23 [Bacteroidota bacterium]